MIETILFLIVCGVAVAAAVMMIVSENAVHSALFLIVNFACVAFFYLMLEAPFLAMVQIAVYAGAIMVLFLFVIMLLGAEKPASGEAGYRWPSLLSVVFAGVLGFAFVVVAGFAILNGKIDLQPPGQREPLFRFVHAATYTGAVDVYVDGEQLAQNLSLTDQLALTPVPAGDHTLRLTDTGTDTAVYEGPFTLAANAEGLPTAYTAVLYGAINNPPLVTFVSSDLSLVPDNQTRVQVFNAFMDTSTISLYDLGLDNRLDTRNDTVLMGDILQGTLSDALVVPEGKAEWVFVDSAKDNARLYTLSSYDLKRETAPLVVLTGEKDINDGTVRAVASTYMASAQQPFGEPANIGQLLFTTYLLPFQMVALLLLVAMIGAIILAHRDMIGSRQQKNVRRRVSRPLTSVISAQTGHDVLASQEADTPAGD